MSMPELLIKNVKVFLFTTLICFNFVRMKKDAMVKPKSLIWFNMLCTYYVVFLCELFTPRDTSQFRRKQLWWFEEEDSKLNYQKQLPQSLVTGPKFQGNIYNP